ncbi:hypothetical protein [Paraburkholderia sp. C35]|uniref:hypothetical protein n=1 Tax=Paraburkholderia sp. C35 TaxID=2126993 RepID=UPI000D692F4D|nr:hypothetical protein [Paraburkholderia sp. C35]
MENMATMARAEAASDRNYERFVRTVERILDCDILDGSDEEGTCDDIFRDGGTPEDAAAEIDMDWQAAADVCAERRAERCLSPGYGS